MNEKRRELTVLEDISLHLCTLSPFFHARLYPGRYEQTSSRYLACGLSASFFAPAWRLYQSFV